jgi:hypothetical protein
MSLENPGLPEINQERFRGEAEEHNKARSITKKLFRRSELSATDIAHEEALVRDAWQKIEAEEAQSPLNELIPGEYRPFILETREAVEAYEGDPRYSLGFVTVYGMKKMFGAVPDEELSHRIFGGTEYIEEETFNEILLNLIAKKIQERPDQSKQLSILELSAGRTYGETLNYARAGGYNYGTPWLSRLTKLTYGNSVDISIVDAVNDWGTTEPFKEMGRHEDMSPLLLEAHQGILTAHDGDPKGYSESLEPQNLMPTKRFSPVLKRRNGDSSFFRPRLDPVFEKMVFGLDAYGHIDITDADKIRAGLGQADKTFDIIFAKNTYERISNDQIPGLLSEDGIYLAGGFHLDHKYTPMQRLVHKNKGVATAIEPGHDYDFMEAFDDYLRSQGLLSDAESLSGQAIFSREEPDEVTRKILSGEWDKSYKPIRQRKQTMNGAEEFISLLKQGAERGIQQA